ncbi:MAG: NAD-dependent epimerase/dehydratase family protein [Proteobacteria bacterium]|nr:NAD-dependent epimerase/dehydratase family protein [Pseudomonadota bacterium]NBP15886.1 NAD-dependent epimerase/dehydratase family protein [bacterium]
MNKIIVFGSTGMLGRYIVAYFQQKTNIQVVGITRNEYDVKSGSVKQLRELLYQHQTDAKTVVFNAVGVIPQSKPQQASDYYMVNFHFSVTLSRVVRELGAHYVLPATDCVFTGMQGNYDESSVMDCDSDYGHSKRMGEAIRGTIIRVSIIGENPKGISLLEWAKSQQGKTVQGYSNHLWNGITCLEYAKFLEHLITNNKLWQGVRHIHSPHVVSKAELLQMISDTFDLDLTIEHTETGTKCDRSLCSVYDCDYQIPPLTTQLQELKAFGNEMK